MDFEHPVLFVGMPRSGTTILFETFARHPELGWLSSHQGLLPGWPGYSRLTRLLDRHEGLRKRRRTSDEQSGWIEKLRDGPAEVYGPWERHCGRAFSESWLLGVDPTAVERRDMRRFLERVLAHQGRSRLTAKFTGPPRMRYLAGLFDAPLFVHVIREPCAVVASLLSVEFWRERGLDRPLWSGGLSVEDREAWERSGRSPAVLAAVQWRRVLETSREEARERQLEVIEVRYEQFVKAPEAELARICQGAGLDLADAMLAELERNRVRDDRNQRAASALDPEDRARVEALTAGVAP